MMFDLSELDRMPENVVVLAGSGLLTKRHLSAPPDMTVVIRNPEQPSLLFEILREEYPENHPLQLQGKKISRDLTVADLNTTDGIFENAEYLVISPLPENRTFENFQNTVAILRGPHGCPWDKKQTHQSIRSDFLQEVYELLDGLDRNDKNMIVEELGDILFHVILQTQMGVDNGEFTMGDVISHVNDKIVFRHEHVFGNPEELDAEQVPQRWEQIKQRERAKQHKKGGLLDGISRSMPALSMAFSYQGRAAKAGFEWETEDDGWRKLAEELDEFKQAQTPQEKEEELGDILFCVVNLARWHKIDPESALRMSNLKFYDRVHHVEKQALDRYPDLFSMPRDEKEMYWNEYKAAGKLEEQS